MKKEKAPFSESENEINNGEQQQQQQKIEIPEELQCSLCKNLLQDAVLVPCCGNSFCDECNFVGRFIIINIIMNYKILYPYSLNLLSPSSSLSLFSSSFFYFPFNKVVVVVAKHTFNLFISLVEYILACDLI